MKRTFTLPDWYRFAPCAEIGGEFWFPEPKEQGVEAKRICAGCPFKWQCLQGALERGEEHGIWGGVAARQLPRIRRQMREAA